MESDVKRKTPKLSLSAGGVLLFVAFCALADPPQVPDDTVPQVTVHAQREAIEPRVKRFVDEYFYLENDEVLHAWDKKTHREIFGDSPIAVVDEFLDTPRPVRAWYNSTQVGAQSGAEGSAVPPSGVSMGSPGDLPVP